MTFEQQFHDKNFYCCCMRFALLRTIVVWSVYFLLETFTCAFTCVCAPRVVVSCILMFSLSRYECFFFAAINSVESLLVALLHIYAEVSPTLTLSVNKLKTYPECQPERQGTRACEETRMSADAHAVGAQVTIQRVCVSVLHFGIRSPKPRHLIHMWISRTPSRGRRVVFI